MNLLSNSIKFTRKGKVEVRVQNNLVRQRIKIVVEDTGKGIARKDIPKIFQMYGKVEGNELENPYGNGIGLSFSRKIAKLLGGDIKFNSKENVGSKFEVWIPINCRTEGSEIKTDSHYSCSEVSEANNRESTSRDLIAIDSSRHNFSGNYKDNPFKISNIPMFRFQCKCPRVIIVDGVDYIHIIMKRQFMALGIYILDCYSGKEAIELLKNYKKLECCKGIEIIFLDLYMDPGMNGVSDCRDSQRNDVKK